MVVNARAGELRAQALDEIRVHLDDVQPLPGDACPCQAACQGARAAAQFQHRLTRSQPARHEPGKHLARWCDGSNAFGIAQKGLEKGKGRGFCVG